MESNASKQLISIPNEQCEGIFMHRALPESCIRGPWDTGTLGFGPQDPECNDRYYDIELGNYHTCTCHKLAAISFFELVEGKGYRQAKLRMRVGKETTEFKYVLLGQVRGGMYSTK